MDVGPIRQSESQNAPWAGMSTTGRWSARLTHRGMPNMLTDARIVYAWATTSRAPFGVATRALSRPLTRPPRRTFGIYRGACLRYGDARRQALSRMALPQ